MRINLRPCDGPAAQSVRVMGSSRKTDDVPTAPSECTWREHAAVTEEKHFPFRASHAQQSNAGDDYDDVSDCDKWIDGHDDECSFK